MRATSDLSRSRSARARVAETLMRQGLASLGTLGSPREACRPHAQHQEVGGVPAGEGQGGHPPRVGKHRGAVGFGHQAGTEHPTGSFGLNPGPAKPPRFLPLR